MWFPKRSYDLWTNHAKWQDSCLLQFWSYVWMQLDVKGNLGDLKQLLASSYPPWCGMVFRFLHGGWWIYSSPVEVKPFCSCWWTFSKYRVSVAAHTVVMVILHVQLVKTWLDQLYRHLPYTHLLPRFIKICSICTHPHKHIQFNKHNCVQINRFVFFLPTGITTNKFKHTCF